MMKISLTALAILAVTGCAVDNTGTTGSPSAASEARDLSIATQVVAEQLGLPASTVGADTPLRTLLSEVDELDFVEILATTEERFRVEITDEQLLTHLGSSDFDAQISKLTARELAAIAAESRARVKGVHEPN